MKKWYIISALVINLLLISAIIYGRLRQKTIQLPADLLPLSEECIENSPMLLASITLIYYIDLDCSIGYRDLMIQDSLRSALLREGTALLTITSGYSIENVRRTFSECGISTDNVLFDPGRRFLYDNEFPGTSRLFVVTNREMQIVCLGNTLLNNSDLDRITKLISKRKRDDRRFIRLPEPVVLMSSACFAGFGS